MSAAWVAGILNVLLVGALIQVLPGYLRDRDRHRHRWVGVPGAPLACADPSCSMIWVAPCDFPSTPREEP